MNVSNEDIQRFWSHVDIRKEDECWLWKNNKDKKGYGRFFLNGKSVHTNRLAWEITNKEKLGKYHALHTCDNPPCCNPRHIFKGTNLDNVKDRDNKGRRIPLSGENHWAKKSPEKVAKGERQGSAKLSETDVIKIRDIHSKNPSRKMIVEKFGISDSQLHRILSGKSWGWLRKK